MVMVDVYNLMREKVGTVELKEEIFSIPINVPLLHQVVVAQLNSKRAGTASTKTRGEVSRSTRKLYRQKGTGRARAGSAGSPTRVGGGIAFGPKPRSYEQKVPKKMRKSALKMALSAKLMDSGLIVLDSLGLDTHKTKEFVKILDRFEVFNKALIVTAHDNERLDLATRNIPYVKVLRYEGLNVYDILNCRYLLLEQPAIPRIEEALLS